jgi:hypothetical protein
MRPITRDPARKSTVLSALSRRALEAGSGAAYDNARILGKETT